jgi:pimeloyl-ACP methyl ester carboxylesterase
VPSDPVVWGGAHGIGRTADDVIDAHPLLSRARKRPARSQVPRGLLLCAPALALPPPPSFRGELGCPVPTTILHGTRDEVIPIDISRAFAARHGARLVEVDDDHSLAGSLPRILSLTRSLGERRG